MALYGKRIEARELRRNGESIGQIARVLDVSKSTISKWCNDIALTEEQVNKLMTIKNDRGLKGRLIGTNKNIQIRRNAIEKADQAGKEAISVLSPREQMLIAVALYWAEGSKSDSNRTFQFTNSDPGMIIFIHDFLILFGVAKEDLYCTIQINEIHRSRIEDVLNFWKNLLGFSNEQLRKTSFIKTKAHKIYENYDTYYGTCRLQVRKSTNLKYKMLGLIKALKEIKPV